ncbi:MAG: tRNA glutamyl-Q(34) synthetase GluQRS [Pseudomonadales bacterium]
MWTAKRWKRSKSVSSTANQHSAPFPNRDGVAGYVGRFAPSPTGPLHMGSLSTALASYLAAKANNGRWLLRIDDIDGPRAEPGASDAILASLEAHGLLWDGPVIRQSDHLEQYRYSAEQLLSAGAAFYCRCSRAQLDSRAPYPGTCRQQQRRLADAAIRVRSFEAQVRFTDALQGPVSTDLGATCGDFVIWRRDGLPAYQLATAIDDGAAAITDVVRGNDLLDSTARQLHLMALLKLSAPNYAHVPVVVDRSQTKLSKRAGAEPLDDRQPATNLKRALVLLGVEQTSLPATADLPAVLAWAAQHWQLQSLRGLQSLTERDS